MNKDNETVTRLLKARKLIERPEFWTKGAYARDMNKSPVNADSPKAMCYCAIGAIHAACCPISLASSNYTILNKMRKALEHELTGCWAGGSVQCYNDNDKTQHSDVLALFDRAIKAASV